MIILKNNVLKRTGKKPISWDAFYKTSEKKKPLVIFCHGYKGFKDWGAWDLVAKAFAEAGFVFIKFNFSHNGGTIEQPIDFPDLDAFATNNYSLELDDLNDIINYSLSDTISINSEINPINVTLMGHSRGGGIVAIKAEEDPRVTNLITWASVCDYGSRFIKGNALKQWQNDGVFYVINGRTKQQMPHYYQFFENFKTNEKRLTIKRAIKQLTIPHLIIHGTNDIAVSHKEAEALHLWNLNSELFIIENANHVFGASHPWKENNLPKDLLKVVNKSLQFLIR
ncbi:alpha/beta hydrolase [Flavobacteriaceae bacterium AU392]|nr:alpha/beta hydrolase [Flavobacteriaceae bacterium]RKM84742.1 alpha/beta hydrolase [Flavobacteriaceae bacterium AU392]